MLVIRPTGFTLFTSTAGSPMLSLAASWLELTDLPSPAAPDPTYQAPSQTVLDWKPATCESTGSNSSPDLQE